MGFVCEFNGDNYAATDYAAEGGAIYIARGDNFVDYASAKESCSGLGGQLATFSNEAQFEAMLIVRNVIGVDTWMGIDDINTEGRWQFVDGDTSFWFVTLFCSCVKPVGHLYVVKPVAPRGLPPRLQARLRRPRQARPRAPAPLPPLVVWPAWTTVPISRSGR